LSDGNTDQFGGIKEKNYKAILLSIQHASMDEQRTKLKEAFEDWKGRFEQLDDACVIGVRIS
jgi:hypothetical protein